MGNPQVKPVHIFIDPELLISYPDAFAAVQQEMDELFAFWKNNRKYDPDLLKDIHISSIPFPVAMQTRGETAAQANNRGQQLPNLNIALSTLVGEYKTMSMSAKPHMPQVYFLLSRKPIVDEQAWFLYTRELLPYRPEMKVYFIARADDRRVIEELKKPFPKGYFKTVEVVYPFPTAVKFITTDLDKSVKPFIHEAYEQKKGLFGHKGPQPAHQPHAPQARPAAPTQAQSPAYRPPSGAAGQPVANQPGVNGNVGANVNPGANANPGTTRPGIPQGGSPAANVTPAAAIHAAGAATNAQANAAANAQANAAATPTSGVTGAANPPSVVTPTPANPPAAPAAPEISAPVDPGNSPAVPPLAQEPVQSPAEKVPPATPSSLTPPVPPAETVPPAPAKLLEEPASGPEKHVEPAGPAELTAGDSKEQPPASGSTEDQTGTALTNFVAGSDLTDKGMPDMDQLDLSSNFQDSEPIQENTLPAPVESGPAPAAAEPAPAPATAATTEEAEKETQRQIVLPQREPAKWRDLPPPEGPDPKKSQDMDFKDGNDNWFIVGASQRGKMHAHEGTFREDDFRIECEGSALVVAVADGAGSCKLSRVGSKLAVETAIKTMTNQLKGNIPTPLHLATVLNNALKEAWDRLQQEVETRKANGQEITFKDLSTTLLLLIYVPDHKIIGVAQVGDGLLFLERDNGEPLPLGSPESGEYSGLTYFLTSTKKDALERKVVVYPITSGMDPHMFCVMTDGVADDLFPPIENVKGLIKPLHKLVNSAEPPADLLKLLQYERAGSFDDRTLVVVYNRDKIQAAAGSANPPA